MNGDKKAVMNWLSDSLNYGNCYLTTKSPFVPVVACVWGSGVGAGGPGVSGLLGRCSVTS